MTEKVDILILGAGLAGLTAGLHLAERGLKPLLLEAAPRPGGRLASTEQVTIAGADFRLEHGVHGIWSPYRNFNAMLARHNLRPLLVPAQEETWVYRRHGFTGWANIGRSIRGSLFPAPLHYLNLFLNPRFLWLLDLRDWFSLFHVWAGLAFALGVDPLAENQPLAGLTLESLTRRWSPALRGLFLGLARNALSAPPEEVPLSGFLGFLRFYSLRRRDSWAFSYLPEQGGASVTEPLAARAQRLGAEIRCEMPVSAIQQEKSGWTVISGEHVFHARNLIVALDSQSAAGLLQPLSADTLFFPASTANAIARFWFSARPRRGAEAGMFSGEFTGHNFFWLERIYDSYRRWARASGGSALEVHIYGPPETLARPDAALLTQILQEVNHVWPELRGARLGQHLQRNPKSHTLPAVGPAPQHLTTLTPWPGLFVAGDWVRHPSPSFFLERAVVTGMAAANQILLQRSLPPWPLLEPLPPEPLVGWIESLMRAGRKWRKKNRQNA